jgi:hypothetical protein
LDDATLLRVAAEILAGACDALGGGVFKKRIARPGGGKSGGLRTIVICANSGFLAFQYGFAKSDKGSLTAEELRGFKRLAREWRNLSAQTASTFLIEVKADGDEEDDR